MSAVIAEIETVEVTVEVDGHRAVVQAIPGLEHGTLFVSLADLDNPVCKVWGNDWSPQWFDLRYMLGLPDAVAAAVAAEFNTQAVWS